MIVNIISGVVVFLVLWPKYLSFDVLGAQISPYTLIVAVALVIIFAARQVRQTVMVVLNEPLGKSWIGFNLLSIFSLMLGSKEASLSSFMREALQVNVLFLIGAASVATGYLTLHLRILWMTLLVAGVLAILEKVLEWPFVAQWFLQLGASFSSDLMTLGEAKYRDGVFRAQSTFEHPIMLASGMAMLASLTIWEYLRNVQKKKFHHFIMPILGLLVAIGGAWASGSRTALLGMVMVLSISILLRLFVLLGKSAPITAFWSTLFFFAFYLMSDALLGSDDSIFGEIIKGRTDDEAMSTELRRIMWDQAWVLFRDSPFLGFGPGAEILAAVQMGDFFTIDNSYIALMVSRGLLGLGFFVFMFLFSFLQTLILIKFSEIIDRLGLIVLFGTVLICTLAIQFGNYIYMGFSYAFFVIGALTAISFNCKILNNSRLDL